MKNAKKIVLPGEVLATSEEFLAGEGTFEQEGFILASYLGKLNLDSEEMVAKVEPINPLVTLRVDDVVLARVQDVKSSMVLVNVFRSVGKVIFKPVDNLVRVFVVGQNTVPDFLMGGVVVVVAHEAEAARTPMKTRSIAMDRGIVYLLRYF